jgi:hypothetical protein
VYLGLLCFHGLGAGTAACPLLGLTLRLSQYYAVVTTQFPEVDNNYTDEPHVPLLTQGLIATQDSVREPKTPTTIPLWNGCHRDASYGRKVQLKHSISA